MLSIAIKEENSHFEHGLKIIISLLVALNFVNLLIKQMLSMLNRQLVKIFLTVYIGGKMCEDLTTVSQRGRQIDNGLEFKCELQGFCIAVFGGKDRVLRFIIP